MIKFDGMRAEENGSKRITQLPAGPYVAKVLDVKIEGEEPDQRLAVMLDISEGPFEGFYMRKYQAQKERGSNYEIKYKGIIRIRIPNPDNQNARYPESDLRRFNDMIWRFQKSNEGFVFDGDEKALKGLEIGISVQEDSLNGNAFTKPVRFEIADDVRQGRVAVMEPRQRNDMPDPMNAPMVDQRSGMPVVEEKLPWNEDEKPW